VSTNDILTLVIALAAVIVSAVAVGITYVQGRGAARSF
jgi:hypothetical protein